jgi:hypothetical protein
LAATPRLQLRLKQNSVKAAKPEANALQRGLPDAANYPGTNNLSIDREKLFCPAEDIGRLPEIQPSEKVPAEICTYETAINRKVAALSYGTILISF